MTKLEESYLRRCLRPKVDCDIPGRLRISFARYALLPDEARPYLHYVEDILKLLPFVHQVHLNPRIGSILVLYAPEEGSARQILRWVDIVVDTGLDIARELEGAQRIHEEALAAHIRRQLVLRLPQTKG